MFKKNLEVLKIKNPKLASELEKIKLNDIKEHIEVYNAESKNLIIAYDGLALDDIYDPIRACKTNWNVNAPKNTQKYDIVLVYGLGLGYLFKRAYVSCNSRIILYEPNIDILRYVLQYVDFSNEFADDRIFITTDKEEALALLSEKYLSEDNLVFLYPNAYAQLMGHEMATFTSDIVEICNLKKMDINTIGRLAKLWADNSMKNILHLKTSRPIDWFKGIYSGKTALIVAAGPSLKDNIDKIKCNREKLIIFCVNRAANILFENNIYPDFILFADAVLDTEKMVVNNKENLKQCQIIADLKVNSAIFENYENIITYFSKNNVISQYLANASNNAFDVMESGSTVTIQSYYCAKLLGIDNIIFAGLDLAFKNDVMYADGEVINKTDDTTISINNSAVNKKKILKVKDIHGNEVLTRDDYALFIRQFEEIFANDINIKRYNISDFGAYIEGMKYTTLENAIKEANAGKNDVDLSTVFEDTTSKWDNLYEQFKQILVIESSKLSFKIDKIKILKDKEKNVFEKLKENKDNKEIYSQSAQLTSEFGQILQEVMNDAFLSEYFQYEFLNIVNMTKKVDGSNIDAFINFKNTEINLLENIINVSENWINLINGIK